MPGETVTVASQIEHVTVYARGARVRRTARVTPPAAGTVRFADLPLALVDDSVRVEVEGPAVVTSVRAALDVPTGEPAAEQPAELRAAGLRVGLAQHEVERLSRALEQLAGAPLVVERAEEPPAAWAEVLAARRTLVAVRAEREKSLREQLAAARSELAAAQRALEAAAERDARAGSARAAKAHEVRKHVELEIAASGPGEVALRVEYRVAAARWAPSYVARLDGGKATCELRAIVAQDSGEDWSGVALRLSTAEPDHFAELPELAPQKIGRRQAEPARRGFKAPPVGADALYLDYDRAFPQIVPSGRTFGAASVYDDSTFEGRAPAPPQMQAELDEERWDDTEITRSGVAAIAPPPRTVSLGMARSAARPAPPMAAPAAAMPLGGAPGGGGGGPWVVGLQPARPMREDAKKRAAKEDVLEAPAELEEGFAVPPPRLDYGRLVMAAPGSPVRGRLVAAPAPARGGSPATLDHLVLPPGFVGEWSHAYDYAFAADGTVDVRSDGAWHSIAVTSRTATIAVRHVAVPREQADVFRLATLTNPFDGPLLPGPIDVYDRGQFLVTTEVEPTPPGAPVELGLGVDASVKIARNASFHEEAAGMLRGALRLVHAIAIEIENLSPRQVEIEVRERVPVVREGDDEVEVTLGRTEPAWERFTPDAEAPGAARLRGGYRWRVPVGPGKKQTLRAGYEVKIAGKHELVGGNRREP